MSQMSTIKISPFDSSKYLIDDEAIAIYLSEILQQNDAGLLAYALGQIAKARGMTEIAQASGMSRESLYKSLRADAQPRFETLANVLMALGLKFSIEPLKPKAPARKVASKSPTGTRKAPGKAASRDKRSTARA
jgi:probable addiction module antidote protein